MENVIFIPGIMGSVLKLNDSTLWPVLFPSAVREISLDKNPEILDAEPLLTFEGIKRFYSVINEWLDSNYPGKYDFFEYDWRHNLLTENTFNRLADRIKDNTTIVAHSMGGLLTYLFVNWCKEEKPNLFKKIKNVITIATPWRGSPDALWRLYYGEPHPSPMFPFTSANVMREVSSTFPSVYQLLPHMEGDLNNDLVFDPNLKRYLFQTEIVNRLFGPKQKELYRELKNFHLNVNQKWPEGITSYAIIGQGYATAKTIVTPVTDVEGSYYQKEKIVMGAGDLTVPVSYALPYDTGTICRYIKASHTGIVKNETVLAWVSSIINGDSEAYHDEFTHIHSEKFSGQVLKVACPVKVSIYREGNQFVAGEASSLEELKQQLDYFYQSENKSNGNEDDLIEEMKVFGDTTYVVSENPSELEYKIEGKAEGLASVEILKYEDGNISEINVFPSIEVEKGAISTLRVTSSNEAVLEVNHEIIIPKKIKHDEDRENLKPKTFVSYSLIHGSELEIGNIIIIQSPIKFSFVINGISQEEFLETRILFNNKKIATNKREIIIEPEPGPNEIVIYSVSKYGKIDENPFKFNFIYDVEPPRTKYNIYLYPDNIQIYLKAIDDSKSSTKTYSKFSEEEVMKEYAGVPISSIYDGGTIEYYSTDIVGNTEGIKKLKLPDETFHANAFITKFERYNDLIEALNLDGLVTITSNGRSIVDHNSKLRKNTTVITVTTSDEQEITLYLNQEIDILWSNHPTEILNADDSKVYPFSFRIVSKEGFLQRDNVKVKLVSKGIKIPPSEIKIAYNKNKQEYEGEFGTPSVPRLVREGKIQFLIKSKVLRETKFKLI
jgi:hypothetical protein